MYGTVLLLKCCCKLESCGTVLLFYCSKLRSCIVVLLSSCFNLVHKHGKTKAKNKNGTNVPAPGKLVHSSSVVAFQIARVIRCSVVDIKRTVDMSPLKRIRLRSHAASELKANRSMRARERRANVGVAQISGTK